MDFSRFTFALASGCERVSQPLVVFANFKLFKALDAIN